MFLFPYVTLHLALHPNQRDRELVSIFYISGTLYNPKPRPIIAMPLIINLLAKGCKQNDGIAN